MIGEFTDLFGGREFGRFFMYFVGGVLHDTCPREQFTSLSTMPVGLQSASPGQDKATIPNIFKLYSMGCIILWKTFSIGRSRSFSLLMVMAYVWIRV